MLTLATVPRPFTGDAAERQQRALFSWRAVVPEAEILLLGAGEGIAAAAAEFGARHLPEVACSPFGTPRLDSVFVRILEVARHPRVCFINADILLLDNFARALRRTRSADFVIGRRTDIGSEPPDMEGDWQRNLRQRVRREGRRGAAHALDYFIFPRRQDLCTWPPYLIGRGAWDNWFVAHARRLGLRLVDATRGITAVHQAHGYNHVSGGGPATWSGPEFEANYRLFGAGRAAGVYDATHILLGPLLLPALGCRHLERRFVAAP